MNEYCQNLINFWLRSKKAFYWLSEKRRSSFPVSIWCSCTTLSSSNFRKCMEGASWQYCNNGYWWRELQLAKLSTAEKPKNSI